MAEWTDGYLVLNDTRHDHINVSFIYGFIKKGPAGLVTFSDGRKLRTIPKDRVFTDRTQARAAAMFAMRCALDDLSDNTERKGPQDEADF